ncbi:MAG: hypothetical protein ACRDEA_17595 [Microcystaceae cyanobacterium]
MYSPPVIVHQPQAIADWVKTLRTRFQNQPIAICTELKRGPLLCVACPKCILMARMCKDITMNTHQGGDRENEYSNR